MCGCNKTASLVRDSPPATSTPVAHVQNIKALDVTQSTLTTPVIIAIVFGCVAFLVLVIGMTWWFWSLRHVKYIPKTINEYGR